MLPNNFFQITIIVKYLPPKSLIKLHGICIQLDSSIIITYRYIILFNPLLSTY